MPAIKPVWNIVRAVPKKETGIVRDAKKQK